MKYIFDHYGREIKFTFDLYGREKEHLSYSTVQKKYPYSNSTV
jgi:hypothetical protein